MTERPSARETADRALILYALIRRAAIEVIVTDGDDLMRRRQAENARQETEHWLERESLTEALTPTERALFDAPTAAWSREAIADGLWRKEALGVLLWALAPGRGHAGDRRGVRRGGSERRDRRRGVGVVVPIGRAAPRSQRDRGRLARGRHVVRRDRGCDR